MKIAMLHYGNSIIDFNNLFGMQVMEIKTLTKLLGQKEIEATLFTKKFIGEHKNISEIKYESFDRFFNDIPFYTRFIDKNKDADIIQGNATPLLALFKPEKTLIRINGHFEFPFSENPIIRKFYNKAHYLFISEYMKKIYLKKYSFFNKDNCYVLHNAVDYRPPPPPKQNQKVKLLFSSRWVAEKGFFLLLRVIKMLEKKRNDIEVIIAGGLHAKTVTTEYEKEYNNKILERTKRLHSIRNVGYVPHDKLLDLFDEVDIHVFPSLWGEPFGLVSAEAAIAEVPTIAFNFGALPEVVQHNETGILIEKSKYEWVNANRLSKAIELLVNKKEYRKNLGKIARKNVIENFNWEKHIDILIGIYRRIIR